MPRGGSSGCGSRKVMKLLTVVGGRIDGPSPVLVVEATSSVALMLFATKRVGGTAGGAIFSNGPTEICKLPHGKNGKSKFKSDIGFLGFEKK